MILKREEEVRTYALKKQRRNVFPPSSAHPFFCWFLLGQNGLQQLYIIVRIKVRDLGRCWGFCNCGKMEEHAFNISASSFCLRFPREKSFLSMELMPQTLLIFMMVLISNQMFIFERDEHKRYAGIGLNILIITAVGESCLPLTTYTRISHLINKKEHTKMTIPLPVCSAKSSIFRPS